MVNVKLHAPAYEFEPRIAKVVSFDLQLHDCELIDLPFYDAERKIPHGLEIANV